jgi:radical SAM protein with 4Fe4S-binding SPASM domain
MDAKKLLTNKSICTLPWHGFELEPNGDVKNCIISKTHLGNINQQNIKDILHSDKNKILKQKMLDDKKPYNCSGCYLQEKGRSNLSSISSRLYYLKEVREEKDLTLYDDVKNFSLKHVDLRWTNSCNQACVYCGPKYSSKWAQELGVKVKSNKEARQEVKDYVFENIAQLKNVYLAGGEPMLMKENLEFLKRLKEKNSKCTVRVNTNLSRTETGIFDLLCEFPNVHWTISAEATKQEYEYIRHHGSWQDFENNLQVINKLNHKISFNMLHFILNYQSVFRCVDYLKSLGFHDNSFIIGPLYGPAYYNLLNLPEPMIDGVCKTLRERLDKKPQGYLKNSYENLLHYFKNTAWQKDIEKFVSETQTRDRRRGTNCRSVFPKLFEELDAYTLE